MSVRLDWPCVHTAVSTLGAPSNALVTPGMSWEQMASSATVSVDCPAGAPCPQATWRDLFAYQDSGGKEAALR